MAGFKEFLADYEKREMENVEKFRTRLKIGKVLSDEIYPPKNRFYRLKEPIAKCPELASVWSAVPFYGTTLITLLPYVDRRTFDEAYTTLKHGFTSKDIDDLISFVKDTGRIQFTLSYPPSFYKNLDFLEPLFIELKPPLVPGIADIVIGEKKCKEYSVEFFTIAEFGFKEYLTHLEFNVAGFWENTPSHILKRLGDYAFLYGSLKFLGYHELVEELECLMMSNYFEALKWFDVFGNTIAVPTFNPLKPIYNLGIERLTKFYELGKGYTTEPREVPIEIGKFILDKLVRYPETLQGCWDIIQYYDDEELYKVLNALNMGLKERNIDMIQEKTNDISGILDNVWAETKKIKKNAEVARWSIGLVGGLSASLAGFGGMGILAGLGLSTVDKIVGMKLDSVGEIVAKFISPNYLVTMYDFKEKHQIQE